MNHRQPLVVAVVGISCAVSTVIALAGTNNHRQGIDRSGRIYLYVTE
jgi:hypothetical protein